MCFVSRNKYTDRFFELFTNFTADIILTIVKLRCVYVYINVCMYICIYNELSDASMLLFISLFVNL